ncbi:NADH:ubiquinone oxidoreductase, 17.2kDa subunit [Pseudohyphozyma bogoriensis]|nr:NADH:ubiquinone oxidoreductase, 17.2kDa subunit [Pseudohyphozyma bogoriensis]
MLRRTARFFRLGKEKFFVGTDLEGNRFYERPSLETPDNWRAAKRTVEYAVKKPLSEYGFQSIPVQWSSWMRRTRREAPSMEELEQDMLRQARLKENVMRLEQQYQLEKLQALETPVEPHALPSASLSNDQPPTAPPPQPTPGSSVPSSPLQPSPPPSPFPPPPPQAPERPTPPGENAGEKKEGTIGEREKARLRREFAKANARPTGGNPDDHYKPETWSPTAAPRH